VTFDVYRTVKVISVGHPGTAIRRSPRRDCTDTERVLDSARAREVLRRARSVPAGFVTTYGDLCPAAPRFAGAVMAACEDPDVPWQRVVRADGSLAKGARQRRLLEAEGIPFRGERVDMELAWFAIDDAAGH
jgi:methylated-DNA-protein-cysteine methyltransferase-like protein